MSQQFWNRRNVVARLFARVNKQGPIPSHVPTLGHCWQWKAGYRAVFRIAAKTTVIASRAAWILFRGRIDKRRPFVLHRCDNGACVRPSHLFLGTQRDNMLDAIRKGRHTSDVTRGRPNPNVRGERNGFSKLTIAKVRAIRSARARGETCVSLGRKFGVDYTLISLIDRRKVWAHA